jgi:histidyl-tRNA synthetase
MKKIEALNVRGTKDLYGDEAELFNFILEKSWFIAKKYNFSRLELPILEFSEIFKRTMGESSDVVNKEIYAFLDRSDNELALRPEFTASVIRALHSNKLLNELPIKWFSSGPVFRYDRPQKGRQRQFNQVNFEVLGLDQSWVDAEVITMSIDLLNELKIKNYKLHLNSLGTKDVREKYCQALREFLEKYKDDLSEDSKVRLEKNPLRILDSKNQLDKEIVMNAPKIASYYDSESQKFFDSVLDLIAMNNIEYVIDNELVRGLDYYTHTVFEIITDDLGAQGTIIAGGRYHNLSQFFGNEAIPCFGCAGGVERLMALSSEELKKTEKIGLLVLGDQNLVHANQLIKQIRDSDLVADLILGNDLKKLMTRANKQKFDFVCIIGDNEIKNDSLILKDLRDGYQMNSKFSLILPSFNEMRERC